MWQRQRDVPCDTLWSIRVIDDQLWLCLGTAGRIYVRNQDLSLDRTLILWDVLTSPKNGNSHCVYDVTERDENLVYIATSEGLFVVEKLGNT